MEYRTESHDKLIISFEKAYIHWYIEMLKPENERNQKVLNMKYQFAQK
jgi:hypothetical protein